MRPPWHPLKNPVRTADSGIRLLSAVTSAAEQDIPFGVVEELLRDTRDGAGGPLAQSKDHATDAPSREGGVRVHRSHARGVGCRFEQRRVAYHEQHQEAFFRAYQIADIREHVIRPGQSVWVLAQRTYSVPVWLLRQYNPDLDLERVNPGTVVKFPHLERIAAESDAV